MVGAGWEWHFGFVIYDAGRSIVLRNIVDGHILLYDLDLQCVSRRFSSLMYTIMRSFIDR